MVAKRCHYEVVFSYFRASNCWVGISPFSQLPMTDGREQLIEGPLATNVPVPSTQSWRKLESAEERMRVEESHFATYSVFCHFQAWGGHERLEDVCVAAEGCSGFRGIYDSTITMTIRHVLDPFSAKTKLLIYFIRYTRSEYVFCP